MTKYELLIWRLRDKKATMCGRLAKDKSLHWIPITKSQCEEIRNSFTQSKSKLDDFTREQFITLQISGEEHRLAVHIFRAKREINCSSAEGNQLLFFRPLGEINL